MQLSILIPLYNSESAILGLVDDIRAFFYDHSFELLLVDDASTDETLQKLRAKLPQWPEVRLFSLKQNQGQQKALSLLLPQAKGSWILTLDDDGQHPLEIFPSLEKKRAEGFDLIFGVEDVPRQRSLRALGFRLRDAFFQRRFPQLKGTRVSALRYFKQELFQEPAYDFVYLSAELLQQAQAVTAVPMQKKKRKGGKSGYSLSRLIKLYLNLRFYYGRFPEFLKKKAKPVIMEEIH